MSQSRITIHLGQSSQHQDILQFLASNTCLYQNLEWLNIEELLNQHQFHVGIDDDNNIVCVLSIPQEDTQFAWVRLAAQNFTDSIDVMKVLWNRVKHILQQQDICCIYALSTNKWSETLLNSWSYTATGAIVALRREYKPTPNITQSLAKIREATYDDLSEITSVDNVVFNDMWQCSSQMLKMALHKAQYATVAVMNNSCIGYLLATIDTNVLFIARLAVSPEYQRQGIGRALIVNMLNRYKDAKYTATEVVTQNDNYASISLYQSLDFQLIGRVARIWTYNFNEKDQCCVK
jgi:ribosomal-protein-alanine N-acetyltransferase